MASDTVEECQPLLGAIVERHDEPINFNGDIDFDPRGDKDNPMEWPMAFKWSIVAMLAFSAFTVTFTCISVVPIASRIVADLDGNNSSKSSSVLLVTIWELGEAAGPLLIAPLSEVYGRYPVMNVANCLFISATLLATLSESTTLFITARALTGMAVASNVLNPAIVGDMFISEQRGTAMSCIMFAPLIGGAIGPAIGGAIAQSLGWRQLLWMCTVLASVCEILFLTCFKETYKVPILRRRAARYQEDFGNGTLGRPAIEPGDGKSLGKLWESVKRPFTVIVGSPVLLAMAVFGSVGFTHFYILSVTLPDILQNLYGLSPALTGSAFLSFSAGAFFSVALCNLALDRVYIRLRDSNNDNGQPEYRLPLAIIGGFMLPVAVMIYGWTAQLRLPLPLMLASVAFTGFTLMLAFLPVMAYVVDAFGLHSASALTGVIVMRCLMGTFLPLTTAPLVDRLGYGWAFTVLEGLSLILAPIPVLLMRYGFRLRQRSEYTKEA